MVLIYRRPRFLPRQQNPDTGPTRWTFKPHHTSAEANHLRSLTCGLAPAVLGRPQVLQAAKTLAGAPEPAPCPRSIRRVLGSTGPCAHPCRARSMPRLHNTPSVDPRWPIRTLRPPDFSPTCVPVGGPIVLKKALPQAPPGTIPATGPRSPRGHALRDCPNFEASIRAGLERTPRTGPAVCPTAFGRPAPQGHHT